MKKPMIITSSILGLLLLVSAAGFAVFYMKSGKKDMGAQQQEAYIEKRSIDFSRMISSKEIRIRSAGDAIMAILVAKDVYAYKGELMASYEGILKFGSLTNKCMVKIASKLSLSSDQLLAESPRIVKFSPYEVSGNQLKKLQEADGVIFELMKEKIKFEPYPLGYPYIRIVKAHNTFIEFER